MVTRAARTSTANFLDSRIWHELLEVGGATDTTDIARVRWLDREGKAPIGRRSRDKYWQSGPRIRSTLGVSAGNASGVSR